MRQGSGPSHRLSFAEAYDAFLRAEEDFASGESDDPLDLRVAEGNLDISARGHV